MTLSDSGATATGFELYTTTASILGPNSGEASRNKSFPMVVMLMVRGGAPGGIKSGRCKAFKFRENEPDEESKTPPAGCRQAPTKAGKHAILRTAIPAPPPRCTP